MENKMKEQVSFFPYEDIEAVFKKAHEEMEKNELEALREFYHNMKFYYEFAIICATDEYYFDPESICSIFEYAKKGAGVNI